MTKTTQAPRICLQCEGPIPEHKIASAKYCHLNCARVASYHRKSPEARKAYNKQSNDRRMRQDLLPILRTLGRSAGEAEIIEGTPLGRYVVGMFLLERLSNWKLDLALNFNQARNTLAALAGGHDELDELEELVTAEMLKVMKKANQ
ncbi:hypothetical protein SAMN05421665_1236 [Yoonia rosea]|uniref:Uncharacterized protein n=1 Tax=Yoonia rosea TaxID=287098 RepID=A0A1R3WV22_9RHOB|nr:hypothetical protein [Yoonia rosea]SIT81222.1 hypothetical protein SAMN05421665_1236 [Yoonia rosea]